MTNDPNWTNHRQLRNVNWQISCMSNGKYESEAVTRAILLDIREELRDLNRLLNCANFIRVPTTLKEIRANTAKPKRKKKP